MKIRIVPYKLGSESAKLLARALSEKLGYTVYRGPAQQNRINIKWGIPNGIGANKLKTFRAFKQHDVAHPDWTEDRTIVKRWLRDGRGVVVRKLLRSSGGKGASYIEGNVDVPVAPLYVDYIKKKKEFRVHVLESQVVHVQEKRKRRGTAPDTRIRSHENDWVFCTENVVEPHDLRTVALKATRAVGHSGAVDIVWNQKQDKCYALEVNSAPGLCPTSAKKYAEWISEHFGHM
jgi:glutathione synthase/RimK-type ligase-like ATP-grasp enzyme